MSEPRRCKWATDQLLIQYHDNDFGRIITDDNKLFEKLSLEIFQAGLSWRTVLAKKEHFEEAFFDFQIDTVARLSDEYLHSLLSNEKIIRNEKKIYATRGNAVAAQKIILDNQSFFKFVYTFRDPEKLLHSLKNYGFTFIGKTMIESFMQSIGVLQAHEVNCFLYRQSTGEVE